ncbi:MAG: tyrosine-protein phosphatase [bacterium]|nr:tyrosine-protein phosphatase [bacterium]
MARLTEAGLAAMRGHGVGTVIDLRSPGERARWPSPVEGWTGYRVPARVRRHSARASGGAIHGRPRGLLPSTPSM